MHFGSLPLDQARGAILAHGLRAGGRSFKKGRVLSAEDLAVLAQGGIAEVMAARLEPSDVPEDAAAAEIAQAIAGPGVRAGAAFTGRSNLYAGAAGLAVIDAAAVDRLNAIDETITVATLPNGSLVTPRQMLATVKIIPFAVPRAAVEEAIAGSWTPPVCLAPFTPHRAALISTVLPGTSDSLLDKTFGAVNTRLTALGSAISLERRIPHRADALAAALGEAYADGCMPIFIFGASAITDRRDVIPAAIERAGGKVLRFGMPVDPGNLLLLAELDGRSVIGLPGCARSPKRNGFDFVLWRLLAGLPITSEAIAQMGVGGLLAEIPTRPQPRDEPAVPHAPKIAALVLAAGQSSRMGTNKLLEELAGKPLLRHAAGAALASQADSVSVVTGHMADRVGEAVGGLPVRLIHNPAYSEGLSSSLRAGLESLPGDVDGALILLGDMPGVDAALIDRLIAAFAPAEGRAICVPVAGGRRGNPVLWARRFFAEMQCLTGDAGARALLGAYGELIAEVEAPDDGPLADIDTRDALEDWRGRQ